MFFKVDKFNTNYMTLPCILLTNKTLGKKMSKGKQEACLFSGGDRGRKATIINHNRKRIFHSFPAHGKQLFSLSSASIYITNSRNVWVAGKSVFKIWTFENGKKCNWFKVHSVHARRLAKSILYWKYECAHGTFCFGVREYFLLYFF